MSNPWWYIFYNFLLWFICFSISYSYWRKDPCEANITNGNEKNTIRFLFVLFLLYSLFTFFGGDNDKYKSFVEEGYKTYGVFRDFESDEPIYAKIASIVGGNFVLWKIVVYGTALLITYFTLKKLKCNNFISLTSFILLALCSYGTARSVLAYSIFLFGFSFFQSYKRIVRLFGFVIIVLSIVAHASMIIPIALIPMMFIKLTKTRVALSLLLLPVVVILFNTLYHFLFDRIGLLGLSGYKLEVYTDPNLSIIGYNDSFLMTIRYLLIYFVIGILVFFSVKSDIKHILPEPISRIVRVGYSLLYISLVIKFSSLPNSDIIFIRYYTMVPFFLYVCWPFFLNRRDIIKSGYVKPYIFINFISGLYLFVMMTYYMYTQAKMHIF